MTTWISLNLPLQYETVDDYYKKIRLYNGNIKQSEVKEYLRERNIIPKRIRHKTRYVNYNIIDITCLDIFSWIREQYDISYDLYCKYKGKIVDKNMFDACVYASGHYNTPCKSLRYAERTLTCMEIIHATISFIEKPCIYILKLSRSFAKTVHADVRGGEYVYKYGMSTNVVERLQSYLGNTFTIFNIIHVGDKNLSAVETAVKHFAKERGEYTTYITNKELISTKFIDDYVDYIHSLVDE